MSRRLIRFDLDGLEVIAEIDPTPWPIKHFEHDRGYVTRDEDGIEYLLTIAASGYVAHPTTPAAQ